MTDEGIKGEKKMLLIFFSLYFHSRLFVVIENGGKSAIEQLKTTVLPISTTPDTKSVASLKHALEALNQATIHKHTFVWQYAATTSMLIFFFSF